MKRAVGLWMAAALWALAGCAGPRAVVDAAPALAVPQGLSGQAFDAWLEAQLRRIEQGRAQARQRYGDDELACWQRFAVNDCLRDARLRRRDALDALRRDELAVNAAGRDHRSGERLRAIQEKTPAAR